MAPEAVGRIAPRGARLRTAVDGDRIDVEVSVDPVGGVLPGVTVSGAAFAVAEPEEEG
jgi:hypothetical protein